MMQLISADSEYAWYVAELLGYVTRPDKSICARVVLEGPGAWYRGRPVLVGAENLRPLAAA